MADRQLRVCHLLGELGSGGRESLILNLARHTSERVSHAVVCFRSDDRMRERFESFDIPVRNLHATSSFDLGAVVRLYRFLRGESFDVLHAHGTSGQLPGRVVRGLGTVPGLVSTHHIVRDANSTPEIWLERATRPLDDLTVAVSHGVKESFAPSDDSAWRVVYNGIDVDDFHETVRRADPNNVREDYGLDDETVLLNIGRYTTDKAQGDLIRAMCHLSKERTGVHLFVVGGRGDHEGRLRREARELGVDDRVSITGRVPSVAEYYNLADAFVSSSIREGLPIVLLEAMAAELPIVATDIPGVREVIEDGVTGVLVPTRSPTAFADGVSRVLADDRSEQLGTAGYERVRKEFGIQQTATRYEELYQEVAPR